MVNINYKTWLSALKIIPGGNMLISKRPPDSLIKKYPIKSIEDPFAEDDWSSWNNLTKVLDKNIQIVGDDLFVTNKERLLKGIKSKAANAILVKPNQIGTLTETIEVIKLAHKNNYKTIISHRSGDSEDTFIADLAVATNSSQIKKLYFGEESYCV